LLGKTKWRIDLKVVRGEEGREKTPNQKIKEGEKEKGGGGSQWEVL
jgi:hypothetical protein